MTKRFALSLSLSLSLSTAIALPGCDEADAKSTPSEAEPVDEEWAVEEERGLSHAEIDHEPDDIDPLDALTATTPDPSATYYDCKDSSAFCFWTKTGYGGTPSTLPKGDFAIKFKDPVWSMLKRKGTYRVKLFGNDNFAGNCAVFGLQDAYAASPNLPFAVKSARRMEPWQQRCC